MTVGVYPLNNGGKAKRSREGRKGCKNLHSECGEYDRMVIAKATARARDRIPSGASSDWSLAGTYLLGRRQEMNPWPHQYHIGNRKMGSVEVRW
jgi:hypothetical protein